MSQQSLTQRPAQGVAVERRRPTIRWALGPLIVYILLILLALAMLFPYYYLVINALKGTRGFAAAWSRFHRSVRWPSRYSSL